MRDTVTGRLKEVFLKQTGYGRLNVEFRRFLIVYTTFITASLLSSSFFNVFLLRLTGSTVALMRYNLLLACVQPFVMLVAVRFLRRFSTRSCMQFGLLLHAAAYLVLALDGNPSEIAVYVLSAAFASGNAFYYTSYTPMLLACTTNANRDAAQGAMGTLSTLGQLTLPLLTGLFISAFGDLAGYRILFALSVGILMAGFFLAYRIRATGDTAKPSPGFVKITLHMLRSRTMMGIMLITLINAMMTSSTAYYASLLMYAFLKKEAVMGTVSTVAAIVTLLSNLIYGRYIHENEHGKSMLFGTLVSIAAALCVCVLQNAVGYVLYAVLYAAAGFFMSAPVVTSYMAVLQNDEVLRDYGAEVHALREYFYAAGRILGILPAIVVGESLHAAAIAMVILAACQLIPVCILRGLKRRNQIC